MNPRPLIASSILLQIVASVGAVIAIIAKIPYQFGGQGDPERVAVDAVTRGTALSPPLPMLLAMAGTTGLARQQGWPRWLGVAATTVMGGFYAIGVSGELAALAAFRGVARGIVLVVDGLGLILALAVAVFGLRELLGRDYMASDGQRRR